MVKYRCNINVFCGSTPFKDYGAEDHYAYKSAQKLADGDLTSWETICHETYDELFAASYRISGDTAFHKMLYKSHLSISGDMLDDLHLLTGETSRYGGSCMDEGVTVKATSTYSGHSAVKIKLTRYQLQNLHRILLKISPSKKPYVRV